MSPIAVGFIGFILILALMAIGVPVGFSMAFIGLAGVGYLVSGSAALAKMAYVPFQLITSYDYATLPLFIFMASIIFVSGQGTSLYDLASKWLGRLRGGLAIASIGAAAGFSAISASSTATAVTVGKVAIPEMRRYGYQPSLATGCVAAGGTMGVLIPPSGMMIIYGLVTQTSIGRLFAAGVIPGILQALFYMATISILCWLNPGFGPRGPSFSFTEKIRAFGSCVEIICLIVLVLGGLFLGWFTPSEAGAIAAFGAIVFSLMRKRLSWQKFTQAGMDTIKTAAMIYCILIGAQLFNYFMALSTIPTVVANFIGSLAIPPLVSVLCMVLVYLILGCFMDCIAMVLLTLPVFFPMVTGLGFDAVWFGVIVVRMTEIGALTPPVGINVFVIKGLVPEVPMSSIFKGIIPFLISDVFHTALLLLVPIVVLFLPRLLYLK